MRYLFDLAEAITLVAGTIALTSVMAAITMASISFIIESLKIITGA